jgi:hypothetical protein
VVDLDWVRLIDGMGVGFSHVSPFLLGSVASEGCLLFSRRIWPCGGVGYDGHNGHWLPSSFMA